MGQDNTFQNIFKNLSANTNILGKLLKKNNEWNWAEEHTNAFNKPKKYITNTPCLAHYNANKENILTTDASTRGLGATLWQRQKDGNLKPVGYASRFLSNTEKKYAINELELIAVVWGREHFRLLIYRKQNELLTDHEALEPLIKKNRSNNTDSARLTRWLDRLAHFDIKIKHIAGKHLGLTDSLSRNPVSKPEPIKNYDEEYVINCIILLKEFINNHDSIDKLGKKEVRTDNSEKREQKSNQSQASYQNKPKPSENKANKSSLLLSSQQPVFHVNIEQPKEDKKNIYLNGHQENRTNGETKSKSRSVSFDKSVERTSKTERLQDEKQSIEEV